MTDQPLSDGDRIELETFRRQQCLRDARRSMLTVTCLGDDIDAPIKKCVMALALLGCEPMWSCCGFDYDGQPLHKSHQSGGRSWIVLRDTPRVQWLEEQYQAYQGVPDYPKGWTFWRGDLLGDARCNLYADIKSHNSWPDEASVHFNETGAIAIAGLERFLFSLANEFSEAKTLRDSNFEFRERYPWWQYLPKSDWHIRKSDLMETR